MLFRIAQEALTNAAKHAGAERVTIELVEEADGLRLAVDDDGVGFDPASVPSSDAGDGVGLRGMRDRVDLFGGTLDLDSAPGRGTSIQVIMPLFPAEGDR